jgi:hypothetical protein
MSKVSAEDKLILTFLITNSEIYRLNEKEALKYIQFYIPKPISRRTYYNYKKMIYSKHSLSFNDYDIDNKNDLQFSKLPEIANSINRNKQLRRFSLLDAKEDLIQQGLKLNIYLNYVDKLNFFPAHFINSLLYSESVINRYRNSIKQFESRSYSNETNQKSLPHNVTIRREYTKCRKNSCSRCKHGPYYYGYWRDKNGKLKKKYIGRNK